MKDSTRCCYAAHPELDVQHAQNRGGYMLGTILIVVLILMLIGALPTWPHSRNWGYYPTGGIGFILLILIILLFMGRI
jgi:hypothetical protein